MGWLGVWDAARHRAVLGAPLEGPQDFKLKR